MEATMTPLLAPVFGLLMASHLTVVADTPPQLEVEPSCAAAATSGINGRTKQACIDSEARAQAELERHWTQFSATDRLRCTDMNRTGGPQSYIELLTCLEMADAAARLNRGTTGAGGGRQ
jgi:hypothetical protein